MDETHVYGLYGEGRILCLSCTRRIYGNSVEKYVRSGDLQILGEDDRGPYARNGLLCDECLRWIFQPDAVETPWWREKLTEEQHLRLLAPFATWLEQLGVDVSNLREIAAVGSN